MADTVTITYNGVEMEVTGEYYAGCRGRMYLRNGDPGYPDEPAEFSIESIEVGGVDISSMFEDLYYRRTNVLSGKPEYYEVMMQIEDLCIDAMRGMIEDDYEGD